MKIIFSCNQPDLSQTSTNVEFLANLIAQYSTMETSVTKTVTVGWGEDPWALVTPVKAIRVGVGL